VSSEPYDWIGKAREITSAPVEVKRSRIEHRPIRLPSEDLSSPKLTQRKMDSSPCRLCLRSSKLRLLTRHHIIPHSWFLKQPLALKFVRNAHANIVGLCRPCHDLVDSQDPEVRRQARVMLRKTLTQAEIAFAIQIRGRDWLETEYPLAFLDRSAVDTPHRRRSEPRS
jgi:5-methylcytosine-specific restriction endonuclease McrA